MIKTLTPYVLTLAYVAINLLVIWKVCSHQIPDIEAFFFFISSTFVTWLCISLNEERQDV